MSDLGHAYHSSHMLQDGLNDDDPVSGNAKAALGAGAASAFGLGAAASTFPATTAAVGTLVGVTAPVSLPVIATVAGLGALGGIIMRQVHRSK